MAAALATDSTAAEAVWRPGQYRLEVRVGLPGMPAIAPPLIGERCLTAADFENGSAFSVLSDTAIKTCPIFDFEVDEASASYQIACPGQNAAGAMAKFEATRTGYRGRIEMHAPGKANMTETQVATRVGECR